ncbi:MAG TPA: hypothetical protein DCX07_03400 [Phycisphaerales bacterium]|nr:hypothetical protein [Phycisphaerales bacterium]
MEQAIAKLPAGKSILPADPIQAHEVRHDAPYGRFEVVSVEGMPFQKALRATVVQEARRSFFLQGLIKTAEDLNKGDVALLTFVARTVSTVEETDQGRLDLSVRALHDPQAVLAGGREFGVPMQWTKFYIPFQVDSVKGGMSAGSVAVFLNAGYLPQVVEVADLRCVSFGKDVSMDAFPKKKYTYPGREPDAPWRKAAAERIEKNRKGNLTVKVVGADGKPVAAADVRVKMLRHRFPFGSVFNVPFYEKNRNTPDGQRYMSEFLRLFNSMVHEGALKWPYWEKNRQSAIDSIDWFRAHGLEVRGHNLMWPRWDRTPWREDKGKWKQLESDKDNMRKLFLDHIQDEAGTLKGKINEWDVINEPWSHYHFMELLGDEVIIDWFQAAHQADPGARLVLNEGNGEGRRGKNLLRLAKILLDAKAPIHGIGLESHFGWGVPGPEASYAIFEQFANLGLNISITEFDQVIDDETLQADWQRDFLTIAFSHPKVTSFTRWGFYNVKGARHPRGFFNPDWTLKPNGKVYTDLVFTQWWTDLQGKTDANGVYQARGFLGDYDVIVTHDRQTWTLAASLDKPGATVQVVLTDEARRAEQARREKEAQRRAAAIEAVKKRMDARLNKNAKEAKGADKAPASRPEVPARNARARIDIKGAMDLRAGDVSAGGEVVPRGGTLIVEVPVNNAEWTRLTFRFTPAADGAVTLRLMGKYVKAPDGDREPVWVYYDELAVEGAAAPVVNGGFEKVEGKDAAGWEGKNKSQARRIQNTTLAHEGKAVVEVWHGASLAQEIQVRKDQPVTITAWCRLAH